MVFGIKPGPKFRARQQRKAEEKAEYEKAYRPERLKAIRAKAVQDARNSTKGGSGIGGRVLAGISKMGEGTSFNTSNPVIFGGEGGGSKKKKRSSGVPDPLEALF